MAEKLNVDKAPYGEEEQRQAAANAAVAEAQAQQEALPSNQAVQGNPQAAQAIEQGAQEAQGEKPAPLPSFLQERPAPQFTGIMQAPGVMQKPMVTPYERDQSVAMMWQVVARSRGTALTQMVANELTGVD